VLSAAVLVLVIEPTAEPSDYDYAHAHDGGSELLGMMIRLCRWPN
jgi:hypothetical protein